MDNLSDKAIKQLADMGATVVAPQTPANGTVPYVIVPQGFAVHDLESLVFNRHRANPERVTQSVAVLDPESFIEYYTLFSDTNSRIFADEEKTSVLGVLDYHGAGSDGSPRWGDHRVNLTLRLSVEWQRWSGRNNQTFGQQQFAEFLEQNAVDISTPSPASITEIARDMEAKTDVEFASGIRMQDGSVRFKYTETLRATVGSGAIDVPERFTLSLPVFIGGDRVNMDALLRYRVKEGKLSIYYTLVRPEEVLRTAFLAARQKIADALKVNILNGNPGGPAA